VAFIATDCATAAGVLRTVLETEVREAQREYEPVAETPAVAWSHVSSNGHAPDPLTPDHAGPVTTNGGGELPAQGVPFGVPIHIPERRIELPEADQ
jgi:hypothetical protein